MLTHPEVQTATADRIMGQCCVCVWGGVSGASVECHCVGVSVRDLVCFDEGLTGLANSEVSVRFTRKTNKFVDPIHWSVPRVPLVFFLN